MERHTYIRLANIDKLIRNKRYPNCKFLADEFETSERTILRDIEAMKDSLGAPIRYSKERNGYYYEEEKFSLPAMRLTEGELVSIFLGAEIIKKLKNTPFGSKVKQAFEKIEAMLPESISLDPEEVSGAFSVQIENTRALDTRSARVFETLAKAIKEKKSVEVEYYSIGRNAVSKRILDPYHLRHMLGTWYLIAYCHFRKDVRTFAVNQIREIKVLKDKFEVQKGFSIEKFFEHSWGIEEGGPLTTVVVKLDKEISRWYVDRRLHPSQKVKENKDGSVTLSFKVAGTDEIKRWILSLGRWAKVLEPEELKRDVKAEARAVAGV